MSRVTPLAIGFWGPAALLLSALLVPVEAAAQGTSASLKGVLMDQTRAVIHGVELSLINLDTGWTRLTRSNSTGQYAFPLLPPGRYTLTASLEGFARVTVDGLRLRTGLDSVVNLTLQPASLSESVTVTAATLQIDLDGATQVVSLMPEQIPYIPLLTSPTGRNVLSVYPFIVPGVVPVDALGGLASDGAGARGEGLSVNGSRSISIRYSLDGADYNDAELGVAASTFPNPDALEEVTVVTSNYKADLGGGAGGVVNTAIRRGTGEFHGNVRTFVLHEGLNAKSFFESQKLRNRLNTIGAQLGGPLPAGESHFFIDYEGNRSNLAFPRRQTVPPLPWRGGDFSALDVSLQPIDPLTGSPFAGGVIPGNRLDPVAIAMMALYPAPSVGENEFNQTGRGDLTLDQVALRVDQSVSERFDWSLTYFWSRNSDETSDSGAPAGSTVEDSADTHAFVFRGTTSSGSSRVNQFTVAANLREDRSQARFGRADGKAPSEFGFAIQPQTDAFLGPPTVAFNSVSMPIGSFHDSSFRDMRSWQFKDDYSVLRGDHLIKMGGELSVLAWDSTAANDNGVFRFGGASNCCGTGLDFADFLLGLAPDLYLQSTGSTILARRTGAGLYVLDEWRWTPSLTLNLGLRYELGRPVVDSDNQIAVFRPGSQSQVFPGAPLGMLFFGDDDPLLGRVPRGAYPTDRNNFAPRIGAALAPQGERGLWRLLFGDGKGVLRAGAGVFYDHAFGRNFTEFQGVQPFSFLEVLESATTSPLGATLADPFGSLPNDWPVDLDPPSFRGQPILQSFDPRFRTAYTYHYNLAYERMMPGSWLLEVAYVGSNTFKQNRERERNPGVVAPGALLTNIEERRLFPQLSSVPVQESTGRARYDSFQVRVARRSASGLTLDASYVLGRSLDDGSSPLGAGNRATPAPGVASPFPLLWARSAFDRRTSLVASYTYPLPRVEGHWFREFLLDGWLVGGLSQVRSGLPLDIAQAFDTTLTGEALNGRPDLIAAFRRLNPRQTQTIGTITGNFFFDPTSFAPVKINDFTEARRGNIRRNGFTGPGQAAHSLLLVKRMEMGERHAVELRADISNLFNQVNFGTPVTLIERTNFGQVITAAPGRRIQLSARYTF